MARSLPIILALFGFVLIGCTPHTPKGDGGSPEASGDKKKAQNRAADIVTTSAALAKEFLEDKANAEAKYKGKRVEVTGVLAMHPREADQFMLSGAKKDTTELVNEYMVRCIVSADQHATVARLAKGQKVKAVGACSPSLTGMFLNVTECVFTELEPSKTFTLTATELAREFETDKEAAAKKFRDQDAILTGEVDEVVKLNDGNFNVLLKGTATTRIKFRLLAKEIGGVAKGKSVEFRAYQPESFSQGEVSIGHRFFMPSK